MQVTRENTNLIQHDPWRTIQTNQKCTWSVHGLSEAIRLRNHALAIVACDLCVSITATFQILYVFVAMEIGSRRILHCNVTEHPTAEWTAQQFREVLADSHPYRFVVHDRDSIFSSLLDRTLEGFGVQVLRTPIRAPKANAFCERLIGTIRRECLDYLIPVNQRHLRQTLKEFVCFYNRGRPHASLGPGIPEPVHANVPASGIYFPPVIA